MKKLANLVVAGAVVTCLFAGSAQAQNGAGPLDFGLTGGINISTLGGSDVEDADNLTGFMAGVSLVIPVSQIFAIQPELLYSRKGAKASSGGFTEEIRLAYIDIPVLARIPFGTNPAMRPVLFAGPAIGFNVGCEVELSGGGLDEKADCDDQDVDIDVKSVEVSLIGGAGLDFNNFGIFARYQHGVTSIDDSPDAGKVYNRLFTIGARISIPMFNR